MPAPGVEPAEHVRRLAEAGRVLEARRYLETVGDEVQGIALWRHLLAPPTVTALDTTSDTADEMGQSSAWLREHASEHRGE